MDYSVFSISIFYQKEGKIKFFISLVSLFYDFSSELFPIFTKFQLYYLKFLERTLKGRFFLIGAGIYLTKFQKLGISHFFRISLFDFHF